MDREFAEKWLNKLKEYWFKVHKFIKMKDELKSFDILNIDKNQYDELLENAIVAILKI